jgi:hypothetical protein
MPKGSPDPNRCHKAIKLLEQFERLARKYAVKLSAKRLQQLNNLRDTGKIKSSDLPRKLQCEFPGEFTGMTVDEIKKKCSK